MLELGSRKEYQERIKNLRNSDKGECKKLEKIEDFSFIKAFEKKTILEEERKIEENRQYISTHTSVISLSILISYNLAVLQLLHP
jgi:hypothetical protein